MRWVNASLIALCVIPGIVFALSLLAEHQAYFWDGTVYRCALEAALASGNPYVFVGDCQGYFLPHTYPYGGTRMLAAIASVVGVAPLSALYLVVYVAGVGLIARQLHALGASVWFIATLLVAPGAGVFVSELVSGNMGVPFYGALLWLVWKHASSSMAPVALGAAMAPFKPLYAAYIGLPFLTQRKRLIPALGALAVAVWYAADAGLFPQFFSLWLANASRHANEVPGFGFSMLVRRAGGQLEGSLAIGAAYALWAGTIIAVTLRAVRGAPSAPVAALIAIAGTALLLPRLKEYDCLVLLPLSCALWPTLLPRERREWIGLVGGFGVALPALIWWLRKVPMLAGGVAEPWRTFVDMRWLVQNQGGFLFAAMLAALIWLANRPGSNHRPPETHS